MDLSIEKAREKGFVQTIMGRKRILNDINSRNGGKGYAERNALTLIQGSAADIIKLAMIHVQNAFQNEGLSQRCYCKFTMN